MVVDDHPVMRDALVQMLGSSVDFRVVASAGTVQETRDGVARARPDVLLLDLMLNGTDSLSLITELAEAFPKTRTLVLSMMNESVYAERAMRAGAYGYVMKSAQSVEVLNALRCVREGRVYLSPRIFVSLFRGLLKRSAKGQPPGTEGLSDRELQIFQLIGAGVPNREIATQLNISIKTVESHRENLKNKLGVNDGTELKEAAMFFVNSLVA
jgi:DNA-binding NarL/FixJ family response regulator